MRRVINAAIIQDNKLLLVKKKATWILPGGKLEENEDDLECLCREISEELSGTQIKDIRYYGSFKGRSPHEEEILTVRVYLSDINGQLYSVREADSISEAKWVNNFSEYNLSEVTSKVVKALQNDGLLG